MLTKDEKQAIIDVLGAGNDDHKFYVYALCDKNDHSKIFYIGKGEEGRVWSHQEACKQACADIDTNASLSEDEKVAKKEQLTEKFKEIERLGNQIEHVIIKWGLTEPEAFMCESALINLWKFANPTSSLTNIVNGHASTKEKNSNLKTTLALTDDEFYKYNAKPTIDKQTFGAQLFSNQYGVQFNGTDVIVVKINQKYRFGMSANEIWNATREDWQINVKTYTNLKVAVAVAHRTIRGIYLISGVKPNSNGNGRYVLIEKTNLSNSESKWLNDIRNNCLDRKLIDINFVQGSLPQYPYK